MTTQRKEDFIHPNERGNGPKERLEGGDDTDDISINDPDTRRKELRASKHGEDDESVTTEVQK